MCKHNWTYSKQPIKLIAPDGCPRIIKHIINKSNERGTYEDKRTCTKCNTVQIRDSVSESYGEYTYDYWYEETKDGKIKTFKELRRSKTINEIW